MTLQKILQRLYWDGYYFGKDGKGRNTMEAFPRAWEGIIEGIKSQKMKPSSKCKFMGHPGSFDLRLNCPECRSVALHNSTIDTLLAKLTTEGT